MVGMTRPLDDLGRIVIPKEIRNSLHMIPGDRVEIEMVQGGILLSPVKAACANCGYTPDLIMLDNICLCRKCAEQAAREAGGGQV
ncbi:MAG: AbrB/MazE/SpoVT family DNA-binding domain-containing protein [Acetanaerobacterium sp.]